MGFKFCVKKNYLYADSLGIWDLNFRNCEYEVWFPKSVWVHGKLPIGKFFPGRLRPKLTITQTLTLTQGGIYWGGNLRVGGAIFLGQFSAHNLYDSNLKNHCTKNEVFINDTSVNVAKFAVSCGFRHICSRNP